MHEKAEQRLSELCQAYSDQISIAENGQFDFDSFFLASKGLRAFIDKHFQSNDDPMGAGEAIYQLTSCFLKANAQRLKQPASQEFRADLSSFIFDFLITEKHTIHVVLPLPESVSVVVTRGQGLIIHDKIRLYLADKKSHFFGNSSHLRLEVKFKGFYNGYANSEFSLKLQSFLKYLIQFAIITNVFDYESKRELYHSLPSLLGDNTSLDINTVLIRTPVEFPNHPDITFPAITLDSEFSHSIQSLKWHDSIAGVSTLEERQNPITNFLSLGMQLYELKAESESAKRIVASCSWLHDSHSAQNKTTAYIHACIALEALLGDQSNGLSSLLAERVAYLLGGDYEEREKLNKKVKGLYKLRSNIVHGSAPNLSREASEKLHELRRLTSSCILKEIQTTIKAHTGSFLPKKKSNYITY